MGLANPVAFVAIIIGLSVVQAQTPVKAKPEAASSTKGKKSPAPSTVAKPPVTSPAISSKPAVASAPAKASTPAKAAAPAKAPAPTKTSAVPQAQPPATVQTKTAPAAPANAVAPTSGKTIAGPADGSSSEAPRTSIRQDSWAVGIMAWPEKIKITDEFGVSHDANVQFYVPSFHLSRRETRAKYGIIYEVYAFFGKADVQTEPGENLSYFQKRVGVYGLGGDVGVFLRPEAKQINIGVSAPIQFRKANFTNPPVGGKVSNKDIFSIGWMFDLRWRITPDVAINQRVGSFLGQPGSLWMINAEWTL